MSEIDFRKGVVDFNLKAGADLPFTITFPYSTNGGTHEMWVGETQDGQGSLLLSQGSGITVTDGDGTASAAVVLPNGFTTSHAGTTVYYSYMLQLGTLAEIMHGQIKLPKGVGRPSVT